MNYNETADKILHAVGGAENIRMLTHCATRLRMEFNDRAKVNDAQIGTLPGVISVVEKGGQFQIVIGNEVQQVYRRLNKALPEKKARQAAIKCEAGRHRRTDYQRYFDHLYPGDPGDYRRGDD